MTVEEQNESTSYIRRTRRPGTGQKLPRRSPALGSRGQSQSAIPVASSTRASVLVSLPSGLAPRVYAA